jgi:hypothetical protein
MGNALASVVFEPGVRFGDGLLFSRALRFVVVGRVVESRGNRINDGFKKPDQCAELISGRRSIN